MARIIIPAKIQYNTENQAKNPARKAIKEPNVVKIDITILATASIIKRRRP